MSMKKDSLISIIIPVFDVASYLEEALDSVLGQSYKNLEIIIIDDGSTDGSGEICDKYADKDMRVRLIHQKNKGLSAARNAGLNAMSGEAVAFFDPDDAICPSFIEEMVCAMIDENVDIAACKFTDHETTGPLIYEKRKNACPSIEPGIYDRVSALRALADGTINVAVWNKLYRRELWTDIRFPDGHVYEDLDTTYRIIDICKKLYFLDRTLYMHRKRPGSITAVHSPENYLDWVKAYTHFESYVKAHIPEIYTSNQLNKVRQSKLNGMIRNYIISDRESREKQTYDGKDMRQWIIRAGQESHIERLGFRTRAAYFFLCSYPWLLKPAYALCHPVRRMIWLITGR